MIGWFIILGYLSAGYLTVAYAGAGACVCFAKSPAWLREWSSCCATPSAATCINMDGMSGWIRLPNFEGFSGNRNAFVFQLLTAVGLLLAYSPVYLRYGRGRDHARDSKSAATTQSARRKQHNLADCFPIGGAAYVGIVWTGSRAGMLVCGCMLLLAAWIGLLERKTALCALVLGGGLLECVLAGRMVASPAGRRTGRKHIVAIAGAGITNLFVCAALLLFAAWRRLAHPRDYIRDRRKCCARRDDLNGLCPRTVRVGN